MAGQHWISSAAYNAGLRLRKRVYSTQPERRAAGNWIWDQLHDAGRKLAEDFGEVFSVGRQWRYGAC